MSILDIIGWYKSSSDVFTLRARVTQDGADFSKYTLDDTDGSWVPKAGDVFTDSAEQSDTVMSVEDPLTFFGVVGAAGWTDGFSTVVRRVGARPKEANFRGSVRAFDNPVTKATDLVVGSGNSIADTLSANAVSYAPTGWAYADVVEIDPQSDLLELQTLHWHSPQGAKILINVNAANRFVIKHNSGVSIPEESAQCPGDADVTVEPGVSAMLVLDTRVGEDHWRIG